MKKFLIKVCVFFLIIAALDFIAGKGFGYLVSRATSGDTGRNNYICDKTNEDILIFGSSRAYRHYNPAIFLDSLGMSCYNCGQEGNGSILNYGRFQLISLRYHPKVIIYDVQPYFDYLVNSDDNHKYLGWLRSYYDKKGIAEVFESVDATEKYKMQSRMYRYNSKFTQIIMDNIHAMKSDGVNGFSPLKNEMDTVKNRMRPASDIIVCDSLKMDYFNKMVKLAEECGSKLVFVASPYWDGRDPALLAYAKAMSQTHGILFLDYTNAPKYLHQDKYFSDGAHLNFRGADEFTRDLIAELKKRGIVTKKLATR